MHVLSISRPKLIWCDITLFRSITVFCGTDITLFRSITVFCGTDSILWNVSRHFLHSVTFLTKGENSVNYITAWKWLLLDELTPELEIRDSK